MVLKGILGGAREEPGRDVVYLNPRKKQAGGPSALTTIGEMSGIRAIIESKSIV
jgi:hypothetical protein